MNECIAAQCSSSQLPEINEPWREHKGGVYRCPVDLAPEEDGSFSVVAASLPGVASQGGDEREALANITEAFQAVMETYKEMGKDIPWLATPSESEQGSFRRWVVVHA